MSHELHEADPARPAEQLVWQPLPYLREIADHLEREHPEVWSWFAETESREKAAEAVRLELLKSTYRIAPDERRTLYDRAAKVAARLQLDLPITFYQSQQSEGLNASIAYIPGEAHLVLHGKVLSMLSDDELSALLGHELSHYRLLDGFDGRYRIAREILSSMTYDASAEPAHLESARLFALNTEICCDRGALFIAGDIETTVSMLVKFETGLDEVSAASYIRQADEIFSREEAKTDGLTHPECFIRARALKLWAELGNEAEPRISQMIAGTPALDALDLLGQRKVAELTRRLINRLLSHPWMQTETVLGHAKLFFDEFAPAGEEDATLAEDLATKDTNLWDYYCYVLLDFVTADAELDEYPLAAAIVLCRQLQLDKRFGPIATKELRLRKKQFERIEREAEKMIAKAAQTTPAS